MWIYFFPKKNAPLYVFQRSKNTKIGLKNVDKKRKKEKKRIQGKG
jgi:hypothetical protein